MPAFKSQIQTSSAFLSGLLLHISFFLLQKTNTKTPTTGLSSCTKQRHDAKDKKNKKEESNTKKKPVRRPVSNIRLNYNLMAAITPWIGNVVMPIPFSERQACEGNFEQ